MKKFVVSLVTVLFLVGCASVISDEKIMANSSIAAGKKIVSIGEVKKIGYDSFYEATAQDGSIYSCSFNGGNVIGMGIVNFQKCDLKK